MEEGRAYLEEEALIDPGEQVDLDAMAGTLIQLLVMEGTPGPVGLAVRAVALILAHMKMESVSEVLAKMMESRLDSMMGKAADKLVEDVQKQLKDMVGVLEGTLGEATTSLAKELGKTAEGLSENATKIAESTGTYRDALTKMGPRGTTHTTVPAHNSMLAPRVQAREGVKARQILIDVGKGSEAGPLEELATCPLTEVKRS